MRQCGVPKAPTSDSLRTRAYQDSATLPEPRPAYASPFSCGVGGPRPMMTHMTYRARAKSRRCCPVSRLVTGTADWRTRGPSWRRRWSRSWETARRARPGRRLVPSWLGSGACAHDPHGSAAGERVRRRHDDLVGRLQASRDLHGVAIVMGDRDRNELRSTVPDHPDLESLGAEEQ